MSDAPASVSKDFIRELIAADVAAQRNEGVLLVLAAFANICCSMVVT
jgi:hypothetical protein